MKSTSGEKRRICSHTIRARQRRSHGTPVSFAHRRCIGSMLDWNSSTWYPSGAIAGPQAPFQPNPSCLTAASCAANEASKR